MTTLPAIGTKPPVDTKLSGSDSSSLNSPRKIKLNPLFRFAKFISGIFQSIAKMFERRNKLENRSASSCESSTESSSESSIEGFLTMAEAVRRNQVESDLKEAEDLHKSERHTRKQLRKDLNELAASLNEKLTATSLQKNTKTPRKQDNLGCTCYLNAGLQCLETSYGLDKVCLDLISKDLSSKSGESLEKLEERILKEWYPIAEFNQEKIKDIDAQEALLNQQISALDINNSEEWLRLTEKRKVLDFHKKVSGSWFKIKEALDEAKKNLSLKKKGLPSCDKTKTELEKEIVELEDKLLELKDRVLFKWSYLLLLQAKAFGSDAQVSEALKLHHSLIFALKKTKEWSYDPFRQRDAAEYFDLWHDMLGITFQYSEVKSAEKEDGKKVFMGPNLQPMNLIPVMIQGSFLASLRSKMYEKRENGTILKKLEGERKELEASLAALPEKEKQQVIASIENCNKKIADLEVLQIENENKTYDIYGDFDESHTFAEAPPQSLTIQLGRFLPSQEKVNGEIPFSRDASRLYTAPLDLSNYFNKEYLNGKKASYKLNGFLVHEGYSSNGGHYISYVRRGDKWFCCDDNKISFCKQPPFSGAYILCYQLEAEGLSKGPSEISPQK